jgi:hypothetical protein
MVRDFLNWPTKQREITFQIGIFFLHKGKGLEDPGTFIAIKVAGTDLHKALFQHSHKESSI